MNKYHETVVTPWIRSLLFQLTMADPVKVILVTLASLLTYAVYPWVVHFKCTDVYTYTS